MPIGSRLDIEHFRLPVTTPDGTMPVDVARPRDGGPHPLVIVFMDVNGVRDELRAFAARFAHAGFFTVLPDLYYRFGANVAFDHRTPVHERSQADIDRLLAVMNALSDAMVMSDVEALCRAFDADPRVSAARAGCVGYCMGGRHVLRAMAHFPDRFVAGAAQFPTAVVTDAPDAPIKTFGAIKGRLYLCAGTQDRLLSASDIAAIRDALDAAGVAYDFDEHPGAGHAYAFAERPSTYDAKAAEADWARTLDLFGSTLP